MTNDELIDQILSDLYKQSNSAVEFFDTFYIYENNVNRLDIVKSQMESEGLIQDYKNRKTGISPLGFKVCFEGGYMHEKIRKERFIKRTIAQQKADIARLKKKVRSRTRWIYFFMILFIASAVFFMLYYLGYIQLGQNNFTDIF